jgi:hypothetical protein
MTCDQRPTFSHHNVSLTWRVVVDVTPPVTSHRCRRVPIIPDLVGHEFPCRLHAPPLSSSVTVTLVLRSLYVVRHRLHFLQSIYHINN